MASLAERMLGAAQLDGRTYQQVERDTTADTQALVVAALSSVAAGLGARAGVRGVILGSIAAMALWVIWTVIVYWVGTSVLPGQDTHADWGKVARTLGFAQAPGVLRVFAIIPVLGEVIRAVVDVWVLIANVIAVRQALDYRSWPRALGVSAIGWGVYVIGFAIVRRMLV